jgi:hypothetical protein
MNEIKPLLCRQCGSQDLELEKGRYVCHYCGTVHYDAGAKKLLDFFTSFLRGRNNKAAAISAVISFIVIVGSAAYFINRADTSARSPEEAKGIRFEKSGKEVEAGKDAIEPAKKVSAEFTDISPLPDVIGNIYFVGMYKNTGETPVYPRAEIALYNAGGEKVAVAKGYGIRGYILPGEKIPISVLVQRAPAYKTVKSIGIPESPSYYQPRPKIDFSKLKMSSPDNQFDSYKVTGRVKNRSGGDTQYVQVAVTAFDESGRIIGHDSNFLGQTVLRNGEEAPFNVDMHLMKGRPARFTVEYNASVYKGSR